MKTGEVLVYDFGVLPSFVTIWNGGPTRAPIEIDVRFRLELWRIAAAFQLRHARQTLTLPAPNSMQSVQLNFMHPAKGAGFGEVRFSDASFDYPASLLSGRYDNLEWMRGAAQHLGLSLEIPFVENDRGSDC